MAKLSEQLRKDADKYYFRMEDYAYQSGKGFAFEHISHYYFELAGGAELLADELHAKGK